MSLSAFLTMIMVLALTWGLFVVLMVVAYKNEQRRKAQTAPLTKSPKYPKTSPKTPNN